MLSAKLLRCIQSSLAEALRLLMGSGPLVVGGVGAGGDRGGIGADRPGLARFEVVEAAATLSAERVRVSTRRGGEAVESFVAGASRARFSRRR